MATKPDQSQNLLLATLPAAERRRLLAGREPIELRVGETLAEPGECLRYAFFPIDSCISLIAPLNSHAQLEVGLVGNEGMLGIPLALGVPNSPLQALVQGAGLAWRVEATAFRRELAASPGLRRSMNRYIHVSLSQLARSAVCTRFHFLEARLARWLLMTHDRAHSNRFRITQELLAHMLGVRRAGVTRAASALRRRNLIRYRRGNLEVLDLRGLESAACSCYASSKDAYERVLSPPSARASRP